MMTPTNTKTPQNPSLRLIDVPALCELWLVKSSWVYDEVEAGRLKAKRLGRQLRFHEDDLRDYLLSAAA